MAKKDKRGGTFTVCLQTEWSSFSMQFMAVVSFLGNALAIRHTQQK